MNASIIHKTWPGCSNRAEAGTSRCGNLFVRETACGNRLARFFHPMSDRYAFDFSRCGMKSDWYQFDTPSDASYYGHWCNPVTRQIVGFAEGDIDLIECDTQEAYRREVAAMLEWQANAHGVTVDEFCERLGGIDDHDGRHDAKAGGDVREMLVAAKEGEA